MLKLTLKFLLGSGFVIAGSLHFAFPRTYLKIVPPALPFPLFLVYLSGFCEVALGALVFTRFAPLAAWGLIALLVAVFPANVYMAWHPELFPRLSASMLWGRLPFQAVFIAWAYWYT